MRKQKQEEKENHSIIPFLPNRAFPIGKIVKGF